MIHRGSSRLIPNPLLGKGGGAVIIDPQVYWQYISSRLYGQLNRLDRHGDNRRWRGINKQTTQIGGH